MRLWVLRCTVLMSLESFFNGTQYDFSHFYEFRAFWLRATHPSFLLFLPVLSYVSSFHMSRFLFSLPLTTFFCYVSLCTFTWRRRIQAPYLSTSKLSKMQFIGHILRVIWESGHTSRNAGEGRILKKRNYYAASEFVIKFSAFIFLRSAAQPLTR